MKKIYSIVLFSLSIFFLASCEDFMDIHQEYIEGGEIIYAPKPDSISFIAGKGRILFRCRAYNSPNVKTVNVYWNDGADSLIIPVTFNAGLDSIEQVLDNMPEKSYTFNVRMVDNFGHNSLTVTNFGSSYSDAYLATLNNRRIKNVALTDKGGIIDWYSAPEGLVRNEVRYTKNDGTLAIAQMPEKDYSVTCPDIKAGSFFEYRSLYIPEEEAIDTFATAWVKWEEALPTEYKYDRSDWKVLAVSDETASDGGGMNTLIDDDLSTYWHSQWDGGNAPLPHWAIIDMQSPKKMAKVELYRRPGNTDAKTAQIFVNDKPEADDAGWTKVAEGVFGDGDKLQIDIPSSVVTTKGRYLKIYLPDTNRDPFTSIAEIYVYGK
ncbi:DUF4998 domain-containing protein [Parabacteroides pacaensis]|uniref:DUF4998 domain-containing protein n=1 Tax=Parabacteroides pacaensis TaxID=2086575 RepID=UPI000D108971|nr:DUF4998 domain-containing protein [Parabacteroides pacaensis]